MYQNWAYFVILLTFQYSVRALSLNVKDLNQNVEDNSNESNDTWFYKDIDGQTGILTAENITKFNSKYLTGRNYGTNCPICYCGVRSSNRIVGGVESEVLEFPWMVLLIKDGSPSCGATLIKDSFIITAAHCTYNIAITSLLARFLEHNYYIREDSNHFDRTIVNVIMHNYYNPQTYDNDVAILQLNSPVPLSYGLARPICLPNPAENFYNRQAIAAGWGTTSFNGASSNVLRKVYVDVFSRQYCLSTGYGNSLTENMLCAGKVYGGQDTCSGDSGGPLMAINYERRYALIGITSFGQECALQNYPGVYVNVARFLNFINSITRNSCGCY